MDSTDGSVALQRCPIMGTQHDLPPETIPVTGIGDDPNRRGRSRNRDGGALVAGVVRGHLKSGASSGSVEGGRRGQDDVRRHFIAYSGGSRGSAGGDQRDEGGHYQRCQSDASDRCHRRRAPKLRRSRRARTSPASAPSSALVATPSVRSRSPVRRSYRSSFSEFDRNRPKMVPYLRVPEGQPGRRRLVGQWSFPAAAG